MNKTSYLAILVAFVLPASLSAQVLVQYTFNTNSNTPGGAAFAPTTTGAGVTATVVSETGFASVSSSSNVPDSGRSRAVTLDQIDNDFATEEDYYEFTLTPTNGGEVLDLTNLTFVFNVSIDNPAPEVPSNYQLRYDDLSDAAGFVTVGETPFADSTAGITADFNLSGPAFSNLTQGITFRLDVRDSGSTDPNRSVRLDTLTVNGAVIPEPSTFAMLLGGVGMLIGFQRGRRRHS